MTNSLFFASISSGKVASGDPGHRRMAAFEKHNDSAFPQCLLLCFLADFMKAFALVKLNLDAICHPGLVKHTIGVAI
jgi:hypothetical protein